MARQNIEIGVIPSGQGGDTFRSAMVKVNDMTTELYGLTTGQGHEDAVNAVLIKYGIGSTILDLGEDLLDWVSITSVAYIRNKNLDRLPTRADYFVVNMPLGTDKSMQIATHATTAVTYTRVKSATWGAWRNSSGEFVTNSNGSAVRLYDGTQIAYATSPTIFPCNVTHGSTYVSQQIGMSFPVTFIDPPIVTWEAANPSGATCWAAGEQVSTTYANGRLFAAVTGGSAYPRYIAIGRWK
ncbi:hypothetical protein ACP9OK_10775 [Pseudomonas sp. B11]